VPENSRRSAKSIAPPSPMTQRVQCWGFA
jgi:hypothetical protein